MKIITWSRIFCCFWRHSKKLFQFHKSLKLTIPSIIVSKKKLIVRLVVYVSILQIIRSYHEQSSFIRIRFFKFLTPWTLFRCTMTYPMSYMFPIAMIKLGMWQILSSLPISFSLLFSRLCPRGTGDRLAKT